ncbi:putative sugar O-methyltransferase [Chloroflexota bacterium]
MKTTRGIASYRAVQSLYQAWRIRDLLREIRNPSVVEIGAGTGRTAYYAYRLGINRYTIIDLPLTCASQAHFLSRVLGVDAIRLYGETGNGIAILPPQAFTRELEHFDLVVNVDSLTEMDFQIAQRYWKDIERKAPMFLSINHEFNQFTVHDLIVNSNKVCEYSSCLYWMRPGYVEEIVKMR